MQRNILVISIIALFVAFMGVKVLAANSSIKGKVTDATTGEALLGTNVILVGTGMGAAADIEGKYLIPNVPAGSYTLRATYIGYKTVAIKIQLKEGQLLEENLKLEPVGMKGKEVVVTAQASGQNSAINQQLASDKIVNVVSAARIQEMPDANAAESIGRLPGVSIIRSGGEGSEVVIRGLAPKYNQIMIDGVEMAATGDWDRSTDLSMISSNMLQGIEVSKTVTPDMDAAVLGGVVNFQIRNAKKTSTGAPEIGLLVQEGYKDILNSYSSYKFAGSIGDRFFNERFGVFVQAVVENVNLSSDQFGGSYDILTKNINIPNPVILNSLNLSFNPSDRQRYDGTVVMDYKLPDGKINLINFFSKSNTKTDSYSKNYVLGGSINYGAGSTLNTLNTITNILDFEQSLFSFNLDVRLSHAYSENVTPDSWNVIFTQTPAAISNIPRYENPELIAQTAALKTDLNSTFFNTVSEANSFSKQRNFSGSVDLEKSIVFSDLITGSFKAGGQYQYSDRGYEYNPAGGAIYYPGTEVFRAAIIRAYPWMTQSPYNINPNGSQQIPITVFSDPGFNYGKFLNGHYSLAPALNLDMIRQSKDIIKNISEAQGWDFLPSSYGKIASSYSGNEYRRAGYIMATVKIGSQLTIIPGVRYQGLQTSYTAARIMAANAAIPYPKTFPHQDTTITEYHGFWLPDMSLIYKPFSWFDVRLAYTNTITYPDFVSITPMISVFSSSAIWHNYALKPARSQNYDLQLSSYTNSIGLLTAGAFLKQIDNLIFSQSSYLTDPSQYPGLPNNTKGFQISTSINNPYRVDVWGAEFDWQTHFWYLPDPLKGLVLNINYTYIFSSAKYPYTILKPGVPPYYRPIQKDTSYTDRLLDQPRDVFNLSLGYDYKDFSTRISMIYQADIFNNTNFWPELRVSKSKYFRVDFSVKQTLPWYGVELFFDINNLNSENDIYVVRGSGFPSLAQDYGMAADLGLRWRLQ
jgi:TonB-dependent receptor